MCLRLAISFLLFWFLCGPVGAEVTRLEGRESFSDSSFELDFSPGAIGASFEGRFDAVGVNFHGQGPGRPENSTVFDPKSPFFGKAVLINTAPEGRTSSDLALVIQFRRPIKRVGMTLGNASAPTTAELSALAPGGRLLGKVQKDLVGITFVGLETDDAEGVLTVVVDYGEEPNPEQLESLIFDPLERTTFTTCIPHIADGKAGNKRLSTSIQFPPRTRADQATVRVFDSAGAPLEITLNGEKASVFQVDLPRVEFVALETDGQSEPVVVGYACIESSFPLTVNFVYRTRGEGTEVSEAGISALPARFSQGATGESDPSVGLETAIAILNPNDEATPVTFCFQLGPEIEGEQWCRATIMPKRSHRAFFLREELSGDGIFGTFRGPLPAGAFRGVFYVSSQNIGPLVVMAIRTINGFPVASLAPGPLSFER